MKIPVNRLLTSFISIIMASTVPTTVHADPAPTNDVTQLWMSVAQGVAKETGQAGAGWALSAIGLAGNDSTQLKNISTQLGKIESELSVMSQQLEAIKVAIDFQTCIQLENDLNPNVIHIQSLYNDYLNFVQTGSDGNPVNVDDINIWLQSVLNGVGTDLIAINTALIDADQNKILGVCIGALTEQYFDDTGTITGPSVNPFNDRAYYSPIQNLINYYYGVQTQGTTLLVEAYHLRACRESGSSNCDFSTISTDVPPDQAYNICTQAVEQTPTATDCNNAKYAVKNPTYNNGMYERVKAQMAYAGAPYSWDYKLGIVMGNSIPILMPASLEDFTNYATFADGKTKITSTPCATPLSSDAPCGYTVGVYNGEFDPGIKYSYYGGVSDQKLWNNIPTGQLDDNELWSGLFDPYNNYIKNKVLPPEQNGNPIINVKGTAADYMNSIGFIDAGDKIILTHDDKHHAWGSTAICNMFTSLTKNMPYCNNKYHSAHVCYSTENGPGCEESGSQLYDTYAAKELTSIINTKTYASGFYYLHYACGNAASCSWSTKPGWLKSQATKDKFFQYRWPKLNIQNLVTKEYDYCTERSSGSSNVPGYLNPAGQYTMCGKDLKEYIDQLLPPPDTDISQTINSNSLQTGHTLSVSATISHNGASKQASLFMGAIHPDGNTMTFVVSLDPLTMKQGFLNNPRSYNALISELKIGNGRQGNYPDIFYYTFGGNEPIGRYQFFTAITTRDGFLDDSIDAGDIISIDTDFFDFKEPN